MIVYWDIVFILNFLMDYFAMYSTAKLSGSYTNQVRLFISSVIGGVFGIFVFTGSCIGIIGIFMSIVMLYIAFLHISAKVFLIFYLNLFLLNGVSGFLNNIFFESNWVDNMLYIENSLCLTLLGGAFGIFAFVIYFRIFKRNVIKERQIQKISIFFEERNIIVAGLMDTGNLLVDPFTGYPVILVFYEKIKGILPDSLKSFLAEKNDLTMNVNIKYKNKIRLIPYITAGEESVLKGFKPDYVLLSDNKERMIKDVIIAVVYNKMSANNEFDAVLNPQL